MLCRSDDDRDGEMTETAREGEYEEAEIRVRRFLFHGAWCVRFEEVR